MKKILFITTRNPYSGRYSGDVIRSLKIINLLKKKFKLDTVCLKKDKLNINEKNLISFKHPHFLIKLIYCLVSIFKVEPIQFGLFYSGEMMQFLKNNANNYDYLFFYHIRSSQYLPVDFNGKTILEMGDLYSDNYFQSYKYLNFFNPLKYIYFLESLLIKRIEKKIFNNFDKVTLFSKRESNKIIKDYTNKVHQIDWSIDQVKNIYSFSKKSHRILFVGNLNYLPNLLACKDFIKNVFPKLKKIWPEVKFCIIGDISKFRKLFLLKKKDIEVLGQKKNISIYVKNSLCGLANLKVATGVQGKVLTYMSHGLPVICSSNVAKNFGTSVLIYKENSDLINKLISLKNSKVKSNLYSKKSIKFSKKFYWKKISLKYLKLLNF